MSIFANIILLIICFIYWIFPPKRVKYLRRLRRTQKRLKLTPTLYEYGDISDRWERAFKWRENGNYLDLVYSLRTKLNVSIDHYYNIPNIVSQGTHLPFSVNFPGIGEMRLKAPSEGLYTQLTSDGPIKKGDVIISLNTCRQDIDKKKKEESDKRQQEEQERYERYLNWEKGKEEREKKELAEKIKERERKRNLEKIVRQELIDCGELFGENAKRPPIPKDIVDAIYRRDGGRCVYCGSTENLHIDHIIPFSRGGATSIENLQLLCQKCNLQKSNKIG